LLTAINPLQLADSPFGEIGGADGFGGVFEGDLFSDVGEVEVHEEERVSSGGGQVVLHSFAVAPALIQHYFFLPTLTLQPSLASAHRLLVQPVLLVPQLESQV